MQKPTACCLNTRNDKNKYRHNEMSISSSKEPEIIMNGEKAHEFLREITPEHITMESEWLNRESSNLIIFTKIQNSKMYFVNGSQTRSPKGKTPQKFKIIEIECKDAELYKMLFTRYFSNESVDQKDIISFLQGMIATYGSESNFEIVLQPLNEIEVSIGPGRGLTMPREYFYYTTWKMILRLR
ncbi:unnamed protein product [Rotaria magnacalcarata]|uniref:Uncharacterized protein n=2 Tax=Rotaria magnacalcarata TaxID=392030 RepID=A0A816VMX8_9BILA|nr:unnamed protein product [Rotaria magnacalcarata]